MVNAYASGTRRRAAVVVQAGPDQRRLSGDPDPRELSSPCHGRETPSARAFREAAAFRISGKFADSRHRLPMPSRRPAATAISSTPRQSCSPSSSAIATRSGAICDALRHQPQLPLYTGPIWRTSLGPAPISQARRLPPSRGRALLGGDACSFPNPNLAGRAGGGTAVGDRLHPPPTHPTTTPRDGTGAHYFYIGNSSLGLVATISDVRASCRRATCRANWDEHLRGKTLVLLVEQGFGDTLCRALLPRVQGLGRPLSIDASLDIVPRIPSGRRRFSWCRAAIRCRRRPPHLSL